MYELIDQKKEKTDIKKRPIYYDSLTNNGLIYDNTNAFFGADLTIRSRKESSRLSKIRSPYKFIKFRIFLY